MKMAIVHKWIILKDVDYTYCGFKNVTDRSGDWDNVTCKRCLKKRKAKTNIETLQTEEQRHSDKVRRECRKSADILSICPHCGKDIRSLTTDKVTNNEG